MAWKDLGHKSGGCEVTASPSMKEHIYYPSFRIEKESEPDIKIGKVMEAEVKLKLVGVRKQEDGKYSCDYEVHAINFGEKSTDEEDLGDEIKRQTSKKKDTYEGE